jgi:hypothetical protein
LPARLSWPTDSEVDLNKNEEALPKNDLKRGMAENPENFGSEQLAVHRRIADYLLEGKSSPTLRTSNENYLHTSIIPGEP